MSIKNQTVTQLKNVPPIYSLLFSCSIFPFVKKCPFFVSLHPIFSIFFSTHFSLLLKEPRIRVMLLAGSDLIESFRVPNLWAHEDVSHQIKGMPVPLHVFFILFVDMSSRNVEFTVEFKLSLRFSISSSSCYDLTIFFLSSWRVFWEILVSVSLNELHHLLKHSFSSTIYCSSIAITSILSDNMSAMMLVLHAFEHSSDVVWVCDIFSQKL